MCYILLHTSYICLKKFCFCISNAYVAMSTFTFKIAYAMHIIRICAFSILTPYQKHIFTYVKKLLVWQRISYAEGMQRGKTNTMQNVCLGMLGGCPEHGQEAGKWNGPANSDVQHLICNWYVQVLNSMQRFEYATGMQKHAWLGMQRHGDMWKHVCNTYVVVCKSV